MKCYNCKKDTEILTYIKYVDGNNEDLTFPWNKHRILKTQDLCAHLMDGSIEYYGIYVVGDTYLFDNNHEWDDMIKNVYPKNIKMMYSSTVKKSYPMNVCEHCGSKQGRYFVYRRVNELIRDMVDINIRNV